MPTPKNFRKYFLIFICAQLLLAHVNLVYAQAVTNDSTYDYTQKGTNPVSSQIEQYLCAPSGASVSTGSTVTVNGNNDLFTCINKMYRFAIVVGVVVGTMFIVVAGYLWMSSNGNQESVDKAKSIFESSITAMVILFAGYILLKALNPDLLKFQNIQPPNIVLPSTPTGSGYGTGTGGITTGGSTQHYILAGYDIGPYATAANHEQVVTQIYNSLANTGLSTSANITQYMQSHSKNPPGTPLTGDMVISATNQYNVDQKLLLALMQADSRFGSDGLATKTHNPGNVGNDDAGNQKDWGTWQAGVNAVADWLTKHRAS